MAARASGGFDVGRTQFVAERIDAHDRLGAVAAFAQGGDNLIAREILAVGMHGVFKIEYQHVGVDFARLVERPLIGAGYIKCGTARDGAKIGHVCRSPPQNEAYPVSPPDALQRALRGEGDVGMAGPKRNRL